MSPYQQEPLEKIDQERAALDLLIGSLDAAKADEIAKDVMAHLAAWEARMIRQIQAIIAGEERPSELKMKEFNDKVQSEAAKMPLQDVAAEYRASGDAARDFVGSLTEDQLALKSVKTLIGYNTHGHYKWARNRIQSRLLD